MLALVATNTLAANWQPAVLKNVQESIIHSPQNGQDYRIQVARLGDPAPQGYPVLYLLDGDAMMPMALAMVQGMMMGPYAQRPGVLLVGVGYPNADPLDLAARARDYTPPDSEGQSNGKHGGAIPFHQFLSHTLKPLLADRYRLDEHKQGIAGHSFGGLYALYNLLHYSEDFQYYFVSSPSLWWGEEQILDDLDYLKNAPNLLRFSVGALEQPVHDVKDARNAREKKQAVRKMVDNVQAVTGKLQSRFPEASITAKVYEGETHGSVIHRALYDNLEAWLGEVAPLPVKDMDEKP